MSQGVCVVHNGIIENFSELRKADVGARPSLRDRDDTEVVVHLITDACTTAQSPCGSDEEALSQLMGAFALANIRGQDDLMIAARQGSPLAIGHGKGEMYLGSDAIALAPFTSDHHLSR